MLDKLQKDIVLSSLDSLLSMEEIVCPYCRRKHGIQFADRRELAKVGPNAYTLTYRCDFCGKTFRLRWSYINDCSTPSFLED
jgi:DNA-directed RNA polymerase subunit RPC12/RpoP